MYINERVFVIIGSFLKPLGVLESLVRLLRKLACGDYKMNHKSSVKTGLWLVYQSFSCDVCHDFPVSISVGQRQSRTVTLFTVSLPTNTVVACRQLLFCCADSTQVLTSEQTVSQQTNTTLGTNTTLRVDGVTFSFGGDCLNLCGWGQRFYKTFVLHFAVPTRRFAKWRTELSKTPSGFKNEQIMTKIRSFMYIVKFGFLRFENAKIRWFSYEVSRTRS